MEWTYWVFTLFHSTKYNRSYRHSRLFNGTEIHHEDKISWNAVLVSHSLSPFVTTKFSFVLHPLCSCSPSLSCNEVETPQISNILSLSLTFAFISQKLPISDLTPTSSARCLTSNYFSLSCTEKNNFSIFFSYHHQHHELYFISFLYIYLFLDKWYLSSFSQLICF